ncbi:dihydrofolate reductase [Pedobacter sp. SD-b]|uniref:Dihydrofolate reductase n=1 Tax=Pedobacter segetis TaxID=2793069 RepID=A0ABS1BHJ5_9SPHI|nr:dihydrofolate reductase [Pedobacter segetis]MBK0382320.1 dihydrofolate reductase [Pedobacter segetis]
MIKNNSNLSLIVATDQENGIGKNNQLLWHLPNDLKFFKKTTSGHSIIMGRKTFDSIGKPLPNRRNIIISRKKDLKIEGVEVYNNLESAVKACADDEEPFIIGGGEIYRESLPFVKHIYITKVHHHFNADTFFPKIEALKWEVIFKEDHQKDDKHAFDYSFMILKRL